MSVEHDTPDAARRDRDRTRPAVLAVVALLAALGGCSPGGRGGDGATGADSASGDQASSSAASKGTGALRFVDVAAPRGINRPLQSGSAEKLLILENVGTGCAFLDADGDGRLDVFLANAGAVAKGRAQEGPGSALYRQTASGSFEDRTEAAGLSFRGWGTGVAVGDVDNDGDPDLFLACYGPNRMYLNRGDGTFVERSAAMGLHEPEDFSTSAVFLDYDAGRLPRSLCRQLCALRPGRARQRRRALPSARHRHRVRPDLLRAGARSTLPRRERTTVPGGDGSSRHELSARGIRPRRRRRGSRRRRRHGSLRRERHHGELPVEEPGERRVRGARADGRDGLERDRAGSGRHGSRRRGTPMGMAISTCS